MHAGVRDDAGETIGTRGYVFSGADGSFLFSFTAGDAADEPDPPCCGGGGDTEPIGPIDPDGLINTIIDNMGMEGATLAHGDLDGTSVVTTDDLILAIEWIATGELPGGAAAATSENNDPTPGGSVDCREAGGVDENGEPCADPDATTPSGPRPDPFDDPFDDNGNWDPCRNLYELIEQIEQNPQNEEDCRLIASCRAADSVVKELNGELSQKREVERIHGLVIGDLSETWKGTRDPNDGLMTSGSPKARAVAKQQAAIEQANSRRTKDRLLTTAAGAAGLAACIGIGFFTGPAVIIAAIACVSASSTFGLTAALANEEYESAIAQAIIDFVTDPAKQAHDSGVDSINGWRSSNCSEIASRIRELQAELNRRYDEEFDACMDRVRANNP